MASRRELLEKAKKGVKESFSRKDLLLMQASRSLDDLDKSASFLYTRLLEWFQLNFPEIDLQNPESLSAVVAEFGCKEDFDKKFLVKVVGEGKAGELLAVSKKSFGAEFDLEDRSAVRALAMQISSLYRTRKEIEDYIETESQKTLKNVSYLIEPLLACRLVTAAGGLEKLAKMPASTIQVIGAETALFKHLRSGTLPPKHGIIFQSSFIRGAPYGQRGRIARALSSKLAIAVKADFYTHNFIAPELKKDFEVRLKEIRALPLEGKTPSYDREKEFQKSKERMKRGFGHRRPFAREGGRRSNEGKRGFRKPQGTRFGRREGGRSNNREQGNRRGKPSFGPRPSKRFGKKRHR
ncbi:MAG: NOP5/NOP56 family protein [Candidatus Micrarchaeia archaeon]